MDIIFWSSNISNMGVISRYVGPYKLKHWIKKFGYQSKVIDFLDFLTAEQLYTATKKYITPETMAIGISTTFLANGHYRWSNGSYSPLPEHVFKVAKRLKTEFNGLKIILGGYGSDQLFLGNIIDASIMSYQDATEDILVEYLDHLKFDKPPPRYKILNKFYNVSAENYKVLNPKSRPHYELANQKNYVIERDDFKFEVDDHILWGETLPMDISRGCIFACRFCNYPHLGKNKLDYIRGFEYVKEEMVNNYEKFGTTNYMILDDTFNETEVKLDAFHKMTETLPFKINYSAYLRADLIHRFPNTAHLLKDSGLWGAFHGLESLHPHASNVVGKAWSGKHAREWIPTLYHDIWGGQVPMHLNFIMGLPQEDLSFIEQTIKWFEENKIYNIGYERLGLVNPKNMGRFTILSEFDRNSTKYGFHFLDDEEIRLYGLNPRAAWKNETWTPSSLTSAYNSIKNTIKERKLEKATVWNLGNMQLMGYSKEFLTTVPREEYDMDLFRERRDNTYKRYYNLLMESTV